MNIAEFRTGKTPLLIATDVASRGLGMLMLHKEMVTKSDHLSTLEIKSAFFHHIEKSAILLASSSALNRIPLIQYVLLSHMPIFNNCIVCVDRAGIGHYRHD